MRRTAWLTRAGNCPVDEIFVRGCIDERPATPHPADGVGASRVVRAYLPLVSGSSKTRRKGPAVGVGCGVWGGGGLVPKWRL